MQIATVFNQFWRIRQDLDLSDSEIALFFAILSEINRARAENNNLLESEVQIGSHKLEILAGISRAGIYRIRNRLKQLGLIDFKNGKGKRNYATYSLGRIFKELSHTETVNETLNKVSHTETLNETVSETLNETLNETVNETLYKNKEYREESKDIYYPESQENTNVFSFDSATSVAEPPNWYKNLGKYQKEIVDTWRTIISPFHPSWIPLVDEALKICYPQQIKNAIVTLAKTKAEAMQELGFEYVMEPLKNGAFGRRSPNGKRKSSNKSSDKRDWVERFKNPAGKQTISDEEFEQYIITGDKRGST